MSKIISLVLMAAAIYFYGCEDTLKQPNTSPEPRDLTVAEEEVLNSGNKFGFKLFKEINKSEDPDKNIFISPFSVSMALGMAYNGAGGQTKKDIQNTLELQGLSIEEVNQAYKSLNEYLPNADNSVDFSIANSIWFKLGYELKEAFKSLNKNYFDAEIRETDFQAPGAADEINGWIEGKTNGLIKKMIEDEIHPLVVMYIINAIYFKADWAYQFDPEKTAEGTFNSPKGPVKADMMKMNSKFMYYSDDKKQVANLPYGNEKYGMMLALPRQGYSIEGLIEEFGQAEWDTWVNSLDSNEMQLALPKFKFGYRIELNDALKALGMKIAFDSGADFSPIFEGHDALFISQVLHKAFVDVNEEGTEAAAVTVIEFRETSVNDDAFMICNKPFLFAIWEKSTKSIIFMGKVTNPVIED